MHLVPKPEGFDIRDKRAEKSGKADEWTPQDAVYEASQRIENATQLVCLWWEKQPDGREILMYSQSTKSRAEHAYLLHKALNDVLDP